MRRIDESADADDQGSAIGGNKGQVTDLSDMSTFANQEKNGMSKNMKGRMRGRIIQKDRQSERHTVAAEDKIEEVDREQDSTQRRVIGSADQGNTSILSDANGIFFDSKVVGTTTPTEVNDVVSSMIATVEQRPDLSHLAKRGSHYGGDASFLESKKRARVDNGDHL